MLLISYTLLLIYALPLLVLLAAFALSSGFATSSPWLEFTVSLSGIYFTSTRDALATFVVPFITAFSVGRIESGTTIHRQTIVLFLVLVGLFLLSMLSYSLVNMYIESFVQQLSTASSESLKQVRQQLLDVCAAYVKETLAYISLLLGVAQSTRAGAKQ
jgi:hypothetical protein